MANRAAKVKGEMRIGIVLSVLLLAVGVGAAWAQTEVSTFDKNVDFAKYKTYKWVPISNSERLDDLTADQLVGTLNVELTKKGLKKSDSDKADLYIGYQIIPAKDKHVNHLNLGVSYGAPAGGSSGTATTTTTVVHSGQLILDMYDANTKQMVWRGMVSDAIDANAKPDKKQKHMDKAVEKLLKGYPPEKN
jgi:Domain of unknown function (DUF4136)